MSPDGALSLALARRGVLASQTYHVLAYVRPDPHAQPEAPCHEGAGWVGRRPG